jgi:hypothetical protein
LFHLNLLISPLSFKLNSLKSLMLNVQLPPRDTMICAQNAPAFLSLRFHYKKCIKFNDVHYLLHCDVSWNLLHPFALSLSARGCNLKLSILSLTFYAWGAIMNFLLEKGRQGKCMFILKYWRKKFLITKNQAFLMLSESF